MSTENKNIPSVLVLGAITPSPDSARAERLEYPALQPSVDNHRPYEYPRMHKFWEAEEGSLEELEAARQLAMQYMLMGSLALQSTTDTKLWSQRYTDASIELYGSPEAATALALWEAQTSGSDRELELPFSTAAEQLRLLLRERYANVFDALDVQTSETQGIEPSLVADKFRAALKVLAADFDTDWGEWTVDLNENKDSLSVIAKDKKIIVGLHRANVQSDKLEALFAHEVLVHALRSVNGAKLSYELSVGLPGYLDAEEGLGVFVEYALTGKVSEKNIDRYVDIAFALGQIDGQMHTRQEMLDYALKRAFDRNELADTKKTEEDIAKEVHAHVNRIYRGSLGDQNIGIFTKDISYYNGFLEIGNYIEGELEAGKSIEEILDYLMLGKFNPGSDQHREYISNQFEKVDSED